jgi:hypothetical protein
MARFRVGVRTAVTSGAAGDPVLNIWNPSAVSFLRVVQVLICANTAPAVSCAVGLARSTARGTATTTTTPDAENNAQSADAPPSGVVVDTAWSVAPTVAADPTMDRWTLGAAAGAGAVLSPVVDLGPGKGLAVKALNAVVVPVLDVTIIFDN